MAAAPPASERRRPRRGSLERPVNGRLYRGTWLLVGLPLLLLAFSVARPAALQAPALPPAFDKDAAAALAADLAATAPNRLPGTPGAASAAGWFRDQLRSYGITVRKEAFTDDRPGPRPRALRQPARREGRPLAEDDRRHGAPRRQRASGPARTTTPRAPPRSLELARAYAPTVRAARVHLPYSLLFLSTDGAVYGGLGAAWFAAHAPEART